MTCTKRYSKWCGSFWGRFGNRNRTWVGTLTAQLLNKAKRVVAIELDDKLIPILQKEIGNNPKFELIHKDALKVNFDEIIGDEEKVKLVANLPYYVTTPIIVKLLKDKHKFQSLTIMIQKEVAERINAKPGNKDYGSLSLLVQYYCNTEIIRKVPPQCFIPRPKVDSIVIKLERLKEPRVKVQMKTIFWYNKKLLQYEKENPMERS